MMKSYLGSYHAFGTHVDANDVVTLVRKALQNVEEELHPQLCYMMPILALVIF